MEKFRTFLKKSILILVIVSIVFLPFYLMYKNDEKNFRKFRETGDPSYVGEEFSRGYVLGCSDTKEDIFQSVESYLEYAGDDYDVEGNLMDLLCWFDEPTEESFLSAYNSLEELRSYFFEIQELQSDLSDGTFDFS